MERKSNKFAHCKKGMSSSRPYTIDTPARQAWRKFRKNPLAMAGTAFIILVTLVSLLGHSIRPDKTINANNQNLLLSRQKPGFTVQMIRVKEDVPQHSFILNWMQGGRPNDYREIAIESFNIKGDSAVVKLYLPNQTAEQQTFALQQLQRDDSHNITADKYVFEKRFILGTDKYGRDMLSRLMNGTVISLAVGAIAVIISLLVGLTLGLLAGYFRGWIDNVIMWFTNVIWAIPTLILVMAITFAFGTGFWKVFLAVGLTMWVEVARIARGQVLSIREKEYIEAARALGFSEARIIFKHILPNILSPIIVISAANFASAILMEAGLSFLGLGAQIPTPSWGNMIREHYAYITTDLAYLAIIPGLLIMLLVLSFMMVGNGLRDALDVRD
jgi:peptide/nickel transport system permease protein